MRAALVQDDLVDGQVEHEALLMMRNHLFLEVEIHPLTVVSVAMVVGLQDA